MIIGGRWVYLTVNENINLFFYIVNGCSSHLPKLLEDKCNIEVLVDVQILRSIEKPQVGW